MNGLKVCGLQFDQLPTYLDRQIGNQVNKVGVVISVSLKKPLQLHKSEFEF